MNYANVQEQAVQRSHVEIINPHVKLQEIRARQAPKKPRVASYCRVSTEEEMQLGSLENQIIHYTNYIRANPDWYYSGVYSDKGKSGTEMTKRTGFNRMIRNALNGEIDIIICKSISRFSRNIVDTLDIVRQLTEKNVEVIFEKERLSSKELTSSLLIKILGTFAEEESRNTSENITWSLTKRFERGEVVAGRLFGYHVKENKEWIIVEDEAEIVREAYRMIIEGYRISEVAKRFIRKAYKKRSGEIDWNGSTIKGMLTNERYTGDVISRKTYMVDFKSQSATINKGQKPKYYVSDHHEAIISKEDFEKVQEILLDRRIKPRTWNPKRTPFSSRIVCSSCGKNFHRMKRRDGTANWRCSSGMKSKLLCKALPIEEDKIEELLIEGFEKRYDYNRRSNDGLLIKQLIKELSAAETVREREQNLLRVELEKALIKENTAILKMLDTEEIKEERKEIEARISNKTKLWEDFDKDHSYREAALKRLKSLKGSDKAINQVLDISFIRAWVIHIKVESPFLFTIKWLDGDETVVGKEGGSEHYESS